MPVFFLIWFCFTVVLYLSYRSIKRKTSFLLNDLLKVSLCGNAAHGLYNQSGPTSFTLVSILSVYLDFYLLSLGQTFVLNNKRSWKVAQVKYCLCLCFPQVEELIIGLEASVSLVSFIWVHPHSMKSVILTQEYWTCVDLPRAQGLCKSNGKKAHLYLRDDSIKWSQDKDGGWWLLLQPGGLSRHPVH